jgi:hypothetical protein
LRGDLAQGVLVGFGVTRTLTALGWWVADRGVR